ncbi:MAG TPA: BTAD domain-containing putative transcriptional regulator [Jiangellales bacterium]|nr:BTAD domain-containing putative transcriptional regulator [Jiangellales bacterium]
MEFRLLGSFQARHGGIPVQLRARRQERRLLAILLLDAGHTVTADRLAELLWDVDDKAMHRGTVHTYMARLRAALRPYDVPVVTQGDGYAVDVDGHTLDISEFEGLVGRVHRASDRGERLQLCDAALDLWRGELLADLFDDRLRERLGRYLDEQRTTLHETRAEAMLELGRPAQVVTDVEPLVDVLPTRERLVAILMTALYRCGRPGDALREYQRCERAMTGNLDLTPGPDLQNLREQIERGDPRLDRPVTPVYQVRVRDQWLPWSVGGHPALDFCNTFAGWGGPRTPGDEWLRSYATLATWLGYADLAEEHVVSRLIWQARQSPVEASSILDEARKLRTYLYASLTHRDDAHAFEVVGRYATAAAKLASFVRDQTGLGRWRVSLRQAGLRLPVHAVALASTELLGDARRYTVQACESPMCGWLFLDDSGRRRWCSVSTCAPRSETGRRLCGTLTTAS